MSGKIEHMNYEKAIERLEEIVNLLENGDQPLDDSIKLFEEGTSLAQRCNNLLENAQQKIVTLTAKENEV